MKTTAVRIYGKNDLRLEEFELPPIGDDEILASVVSDCICMSSYKGAIQGAEHKRIPDDVANNPTILGHEFSGEIIKVGSKWQSAYKVGEKYSIQPALNYKGSLFAPGYSYKYIGGNATYIVIPNEVMELGCLLPYNGDAFFYASLAEPMSCVIGAFHANYHTKSGSYEHNMGIVRGGNMAILAGAGPMGLGAIDYIIHCDRRPGLLVVTDIDDTKLTRASKVLTVEEAAKNGVKLIYLNTGCSEELLALTDGKGYDDVFVYAPVAPLLELGDNILGRDGCLNFFAGPTDLSFTAKLNFYNVHYTSTHIVGTSGGNTSDMLESLSMMEKGLINPAAMITHVGGLDSVIDSTLNLPNIPGGKKLIYTHISMPLTAIDEFENIDDPMFRQLAEIVKKNNNLWCFDAERVLLNAKGFKI
ncbi:MAG: zinc-binding dehydrogenase [Oscillospiraceae bacterium]|jgi:threonine dehydrogenase-like Zn-dependent dehydrogenase|nr:zinc-binding dehydrogenase [Oscillospiraceae bacterium]